MELTIRRSVEVKRTARAMQLEGLFDVPPGERSEREWRLSLPVEGDDWNVGLVVGPSGSGKSSVAREAFGGAMVDGFDWPADRSLVDGFPPGMGIQEITSHLSSVGFSTPPAWLRPFRCLSNGEQFRATIARALAESPGLCVVDEFTSVVDRTVAQVGSAAVAKAVRRAGKKFVAVTCHYDVADWLDPDWVLEMPDGAFARRSLRRRPPIELEVVRVHRSAWELFKHHHYLDTTLHVTAKCFVALLAGKPAAFASVISFQHPRRPGWREHRTVCLPDYQGVGIGNALSEYVGGLMRATGKPYYSSTGNPAMIRHRARSPLWEVNRKPSLVNRHTGRGDSDLLKTRAWNRITAGFEFVGPARSDDARRFGLV
jgi:energy-coupling factor transporter ATP-binding protein EcfA2